MKKWISLVVVAALLSGCSALSRIGLPWGKAPPPPPPQVDELSFEGGAIGQHWEGNVLVLDLTTAAAEGRVTATPTYARGWPMRIAVRTLPGRFGALEVQGAQRAVLPVTTEGAGSIDLAIPPEVFAPGTPRMELHWGASIAPAVVFPEAPAPAQASSTP